MGMSGIRYYEDEIYCDWVRLYNCKNYQELMTKFMQGEIDMGRIGNKLPYSDPDCERFNSCSYYWELTQFLNQQEESMKKNLTEKFMYIAPFNCKKDDRWDGKEHGEKGKIAVCHGKTCKPCKPDMYLKSDQFGFSVAAFATHPYGILFEITQRQDNAVKKKEHSIYRLFNPQNEYNENDLEEMKKVLNNVRVLTIAHSNRMQDVVNQYKK